MEARIARGPLTPMELKVGGSPFKAVASRRSADLERALDRRTKEKVSALLSPESQQAILMVRQEIGVDRKTTQEKTVKTMTSPVPEHPSSSSSRDASDDVSDASHVGFGAFLERMCTARLHGDITDKNSTHRISRKRALRAGDRLHTAMEVVEIVRHDDSDDDDNNDNNDRHHQHHQQQQQQPHYDDTDDEQEAMQRTSDLLSQQRCRAWLEMHFLHGDARGSQFRRGDDFRSDRDVSSLSVSSGAER